jgi:hypothetical protein
LFKEKKNLYPLILKLLKQSADLNNSSSSTYLDQLNRLYERSEQIEANPHPTLKRKLSKIQFLLAIRFIRQNKFQLARKMFTQASLCGFKINDEFDVLRIKAEIGSGEYDSAGDMIKKMGDRDFSSSYNQIFADFCIEVAEHKSALLLEKLKTPNHNFLVRYFLPDSSSVCALNESYNEILKFYELAFAKANQKTQKEALDLDFVQF